MVPCFTFLSTALLALSAVSGQIIKQEWTPYDFPNPRTDAVSCGFPDNYPSYICDPNGILGSDVKEVNWILKDVAINSTKCPCSTYFCETSGKGKGYNIGVALVRRMKPQTSSEGKVISAEDRAQQFAYVLMKTGWRMGSCEEDIIIFYSVDDKMLSIYTGRTAGKKLTPYYRDLLAYKVGGRLNDGRIVEALNVLIYDIKIVLNCDSGECSLYEASKVNNAGIASVSISHLAILLSAFVALLWHH